MICSWVALAPAVVAPTRNTACVTLLRRMGGEPTVARGGRIFLIELSKFSGSMTISLWGPFSVREV